MLYAAAVDAVIPVCLIVAALLRGSLISLGYLLFFLAYFVVHPIKSAPIHANNRRQRRHVVVRTYFTALLLYCLAVCIGHIIFQMFMVSNHLQNSARAQLVGYHSLDSALVVMQSLVVDAVMFCVSLAALMAVVRFVTRERAPVPVPHELAHKAMLFFCVFVCGVANPSALSAPYFVTFMAYLLLWAADRATYGNAVPQVPRVATVYVAAHIIFTYAFQFRGVEDVMSDEGADMLGMFLTRRMHTQDLPAIVVFLSELALFVVISRSDTEREAVQLAADNARALDRLASQQRAAATAAAAAAQRQPSAPLGGKGLRSRISMVSSSPEQQPSSSSSLPPSGTYAHSSSVTEEDEASLSPFARDESLRHVFHRMIRLYGRFSCLATLLAAAFLNPTWLSAGLLACFALGVCLRRSSFDRIAPFVLAYAAMVVVMQYVYAIPHLLPTSRDLDMVGMSRHRPYPVTYLVVGVLPVLMLAGYARLRRIASSDMSFYDILNAVAVGDLQVLRRAVSKDPTVVHRRTQTGQTALHIAAAHGQPSVAAFLLDHRASPVAQDRHGDTPLHLSYRFIHDETTMVIVNHPKAREHRTDMYMLRNRGGKAFDQQTHGATDLAKSSAFRAYKFVEVMVLKHADKLALTVLFVAGIDHVNIFNSGYIVFFMAFFPFPALAERGWSVLVWYAATVLLLQYSWSVYFANSDDGAEQRYTWASTWGFVRAKNLWREFVWFYSVLILSALQLTVYRRLQRKQDILSQLRNGQYFESMWVNRTLLIVSNVLKVNGLPLCYSLFVVAALYRSVSVVRMGYLVVLLLCFVMHEVAPTHNAFWRRYWLLVVLYTTAVLLVVYISQFETVQRWLVAHWPSSWHARMPISAFGLSRHTGRSSLLSFLLLPASVYVATVLELRVLWEPQIQSIFEDSAVVTTPNAALMQPLLARPEDDLRTRAAMMDDADGNGTGDSKRQDEVAMTPALNKSGGGGGGGGIHLKPATTATTAATTRMTDGSSSDDPSFWWESRVSRFMRSTMAAIVAHIGKVLAVFLWINISAIENANVINAGFLVLLIVFMPIARGRILWVPIMVYGTLVLLIRYAYQFPDPAARITAQTRWIGVDNYEQRLFRHLLAEVVVLALCVTQRHCQRELEAQLAHCDHEDDDDDDNAADDVHDPEKKLRVYHHMTGDMGADMMSEQQQQQPLSPYRRVRVKWTTQLRIYLSNVWAWMVYGASQFYTMIGMQLTLTMVLLDAYARCNALSVGQVMAVVYYVVYGRDRLVRWWGVLGVVMFIALVAQYFLAMGARPGTTFPWSAWKIQHQRWLLLGGYTSVDLNWDFFALLAMVVQTRHFAEDRRIAEARRHRESLSLPPKLPKGHPNMRRVEGNVDAWYNSFFAESSFYVFSLFDKAIILFVFYAGTRKPAVLNIGYVMMALAILMRKGIISVQAHTDGTLRDDAFVKYRSAWQRIALYNAFILLVRICYQVPWIPNAYYESPVVRWERLVGLNQFTASESTNVASRAYGGGAVYAILIFLLIDLMMLVFREPGYDAVLVYYQTNRRQSEYRGPESAQQRKLARITALAQLMHKRKMFRVRLHNVQMRMHDFGQESVGLAELFPDPEVWPTKPPDDGPPLLESGAAAAAAAAASGGGGGNDDDSDIDEPLPPEMVGLLSREALEEHGKALREQRLLLGDDDGDGDTKKRKKSSKGEVGGIGSGDDDGGFLDVLEQTHDDDGHGNDDDDDGDGDGGGVEEEGWVVRKVGAFDTAVRGYLMKRIDYTLWMMKAVDPVTNTFRDTQPPMRVYSTATLLRRFLTSHSEVVCYLLFMINLYASGTMIELFIPCLVFVYALMQSPRAPLGFWRFCMMYLAVVVTLKFLFQLEAFCVTAGDHRYTLQPTPYCATLNFGYTSDQELGPDYMLGIYKTRGPAFFGYIFWDLMCLIACVWHRMLMISKGVWYIDEERLGDNILQQQLPYRYPQPQPSSRDGSVDEDDDTDGDDDDDDDDEKKTAADGKAKSPKGKQRRKKMKKQKSTRAMALAAGEVMQKRYSQAAKGAEAVLQSVWIRVVPTFLRDYFFTLVPRDKDHIHVVKPGEDYYGLGFTVELVCAVYILFYYPRLATTSQSTAAAAISSNMLSGYMVLCLLVQMTIITLDRVFYLYRSLRWKLVLQYSTLVYWIYLMFVSWPRASQLTFTDNAYLRFFFFLKAIYFMLGALQIKHGYPAVERTGFQYIMRRPGIMRAYMFRIYRALPFVFEMRSLLDWMAHESSLDLWEHLKLEDVHANMFLAQCDIIYRKMHPRGSAQPGYMRFLNGALIFALLMLVVFLPLIFFSSANPATQGNPVEAASVSISIVGPAGMYRLLTVSSIASLSAVDDDTFSMLKGERIISDDAQRNVQNITLVPFGDAYWAISPPSRDVLMASLRDPDVAMKVRIDYSFQRDKPADHRVATDDNMVVIDQTHQAKLADIIDDKSAVREITIDGLVPRFIRLPSSGGPIILTTSRLDATIRMEPAATASGESYWQVFSDVAHDIGVVFITISNPVFQNPLGLSTYTFSIVGLYSIVVLTVGRLVRLNFGGLMFLIPFEDLHDVDDLVSICEGVLIARYTHQYMKEERIYRQLIWIYRTPPLLRRITRRVDEDDDDDVE